MLFKWFTFLFYSNLENWCDGKVDRWLNWQNTRVSSTKSRYVTAEGIYLPKTISMTYIQVCFDYVYSLTNGWNFIKIFVEISASRTKMMVVNNFSKVRGTTKNVSYPQPEGTLGEHMIKHGKDLGEDMMFGEWWWILFGLMPPFGYDELKDTCQQS